MRNESSAPSSSTGGNSHWFLLALLLLVFPGRLLAAGTCRSGSGTCSDDFDGASGTELTMYSSAWTKVKGTSDIYTTGSGAVAIAGNNYAYYSYAASSSDTSQLTVEPSNTTGAYTREACVRLTSGVGGYCVGFGGVSNGSYSNCYIEKSGQSLGNANCGLVTAAVRHTLSIIASGEANTTLDIYLDGTRTGSVVDKNQTLTNRSSGFALVGNGKPADSLASGWQDFQGVSASPAAVAERPAPAFACSSGSGSCYDTFAGAAGADLTQYNNLWKKAKGTASAYVTGAKSVRVPGLNYVYYYYTASNSDTSQITVNPSTSSTAYAREACVRVTQDVGGYCVGFGGAAGGVYNNCYIEKRGQYIGSANCGFPTSTASHTLVITAKGTAQVTLQVYLDGIAMRPVVDTVSTLQQPHSGFALIGDGVAANSDAGTWRDYREVLVTPSPLFIPAAGNYSTAQNIVLSTIPSAVVHYTTDGSTPTMVSPIYSGPIKVASSLTVKALALVNGQLPSTASIAAYSINPPTLPAPAFSKSSPYAGSATTVAILNSVTGAEILYCLDVSNTCIPTIPYTSAIDFAATGYIRAQTALAGFLSSAISVWHGTWSAAQITTTACPEGTQYKTYSGCRISASGGLPPYVFGWSTVSNNGLVEGLTLDPLTGMISGTVYGQGVYSVPFTVTDATNSTVTKIVTMPMRGDNTTGGCSLFPADSIWHLNVSKLPVDASPAAPISSNYINASLHLVFGQDLEDGGIPFLRVPYSQRNVPVSTTVYQSYFTSGPFPAYAPVEATENSGEGADRHVSIIQTGGGGNHCKLWEMWHGAPTSTGWTDASNAYWDLESYDMLPQDTGSTDAAGLPITPLLWNYDEVAGGCAAGAECGVVKHPARLTLNQTLQRHVWPATAQSGLGYCTGGYQDYNQLLSQSNPPTFCSGSSPMGEIYRLKSSAASPAACVGHPQAQVLLTAMRNYGLIVADNGITGGVVATADSRWDDKDLSCLTSIKLSDFEPVNVSSKMIDLNSSQIRP